MNNRGSILVITSCFVLVFTMLGLAAIHLAGISNQMAEQENFSSQALWLADAGVEKARRKIVSAGTIVETGSLGDGTYFINAQRANCSTLPGVYTPCTNKWDIHRSSGTIPGVVPPKTRAIKAVVSRYKIEDVLITEGPIILAGGNCPPASVEIQVEGVPVTNDPCQYLSPNTPISFNEIFYGMSFAEAKAVAADESSRNWNHNPSLGSVITYVGSSNNLNVNTNSFSGSGLLLIQNTKTTGNKSIDVTFNGGVFSGIMWLEGGNITFKLNGNFTINGAIFFNGSPLDTTKISGTLTLNFSPTEIENAVNHMQTEIKTTQPELISWQEIY